MPKELELGIHLQLHGQGQVPTKVAVFGECHALPGLFPAGKDPPAGCRVSPNFGSTDK